MSQMKNKIYKQLHRSLQGSDKIEKHFKVQSDNQSLDSNYINNKLMNLRSLDTKVEDNNTLSDDKKQALKQEIDKTKQSIDRQRNIIIDQLNGASNKTSNRRYLK